MSTANYESFVDRDAERVVLGAMLSGTLCNGEFPPPELFFEPSHRIIYRVLVEFVEHGVPPDIITLTNLLRKRGELKKAGGAFAVTELGTDYSGKAPELVEYELGQLRECRARREQRRIAERMLKGDITPTDARAELDAIVKQSGVSEPRKTWEDALAEAEVTSTELHDLELTPRKKLLGDWFCEGDCGFIFAFRGVGKTWLALAIAQALATGGKLGSWQAHEPVSVLYLDSEMPADLMRKRSDGLGHHDNLRLLNHEILFERTEKVLNIANPQIQGAITKRCVETGVKVLFIDNLSTAAFGMRENEADSWEKMNPWLLDLRRRKIAVVIVHHAGRSGEMRGTSKREDNVFWIIALDDRKKNADDKRGARFISHFTKPSRNTQEEVPPVEWHFVTEPSGEVNIAHKVAQSLDVFLGLIEDGVTECSEIAEEMKVSKATISRIAKKAISENKIIKKGREYFLKEGAKIADKS